MSTELQIAVVGATGVVGETMLSILAERDLAISAVFPLASENSVGKSAEFGSRSLAINDLADFDFSEARYALFSAGAEVSKHYAPKAVEAGCTVIDNSSYFRTWDEIPLVVPEVNGYVLDDFPRPGIIANPNCSTIQLVMALAPVHRVAGIARINVATYQSVSGAGRKAMEELARQTADKLSFRGIHIDVFKQPIAFNVLPQIDSLQENGFSREEMKMQWETAKILADEKIGVNATAVRVPVFFGHGEAVHFETRDEIDLSDLKQLIGGAAGVCMLDAAEEYGAPTQLTHAAGRDEVYVGRIRKDPTHPRGFDCWVVADNVRKGAALNAIQILEYLEQASKAGGK